MALSDDEKDVCHRAHTVGMHSSLSQGNHLEISDIFPAQMTETVTLHTSHQHGWHSLYWDSQRLTPLSITRKATKW